MKDDSQTSPGEFGRHQLNFSPFSQFSVPYDVGERKGTTVVK
jgi:hypothetical protein